MDNKLTEEIKEAIKKNLPEQVSNTLSEVLIEYEELKNEVETLNKGVKTLRETCDKQTAKVDELEKLKLEIEHIAIDEEMLKEDKNKFEQEKWKIEKQLVEKDLACEIEKVNLMKSNFDVVFKNTIVREEVTRTASHSDNCYTDNSGQFYNGGAGQNSSEDKTTTKSKE